MWQAGPWDRLLWGRRILQKPWLCSREASWFAVKTDNLAEASEQVVLLEEYFPAGDQEQKDIVIEA